MKNHKALYAAASSSAQTWWCFNSTTTHSHAPLHSFENAHMTSDFGFQYSSGGDTSLWYGLGYSADLLHAVPWLCIPPLSQTEAQEHRTLWLGTTEHGSVARMFFHKFRRTEANEKWQMFYVKMRMGLILHRLVFPKPQPIRSNHWIHRHKCIHRHTDTNNPMLLIQCIST